MKLIEGIVYSKDVGKIVDALETMGLIVHDGHRTVNNGIIKGMAYIYDMVTRIRIRTVIGDEMVGIVMETLHGFGDCKIAILPAESVCLA